MTLMNPEPVWLSSTRTARHLKSRALLVLLCALLTFHAQGEQYRSKVFLDSNKQLSESASVSLDELEQQINTMTDAYSKSTTGRYLAQHYVNEQEYGKAIEYYNTALNAEGLSGIANRVLLKELASVYMLEKQYEPAIKTFKRLQLSLSGEPGTSGSVVSSTLDTASTILLAQAYFGVRDYLAVVETLDPLLLQIDQPLKVSPIPNAGLTEQQLNQMLGLYYNVGSYGQSEKILQQLIKRNAAEFKYWQQLTSILVMQKKHKPALDRLSLAREKQLPLRSQDILLLADLYVANKAPAKGARLLEQAIAKKQIENTESSIKRIFEYWLQARDNEKAANTLKRHLKQIKDFSLFVRLAELQMSQDQWENMNKTMLAACSPVLNDKYVSHANLLLGVSQLKLGDTENARRSFINATLIGGRGDKAREWLDYMKAATPSDDERSQISGPCRPHDRKVRYVKHRTTPSAETVSVATLAAGEKSSEAAAPQPVEIKTIAAQSLYGIKLSVTPEEMASAIKQKALRAGISLVKSGGSIAGPLHLLFDKGLVEGEPLKFRLAFPYKGKPKNKGPYRAKTAATLKCAYLTHTGPATELPAAWSKLYKQATAAGFKPSGESRMILNVDSSNPSDVLSFELQLGVL